MNVVNHKVDLVYQISCWFESTATVNFTAFKQLTNFQINTRALIQKWLKSHSLDRSPHSNDTNGGAGRSFEYTAHNLNLHGWWSQLYHIPKTLDVHGRINKEDTRLALHADIFTGNQNDDGIRSASCVTITSMKGAKYGIRPTRI